MRCSLLSVCDADLVFAEVLRFVGSRPDLIVSVQIPSKTRAYDPSKDACVLVMRKGMSLIASLSYSVLKKVRELTECLFETHQFGIFSQVRKLRGE